MRFKVKPYQHQLDAVLRFQYEEYGGLFLEQGLGKTKIMLDIIANSQTRHTLVLAPNGLHANWYHKEAPEHFPDDYCAYYWKGKPTSKKAKNTLRYFLDTFDNSIPSFLFMNVEAIRTKDGLATCIHYLRSRTKSLLVVDESTCIKNPKAQVTKTCFKLAEMVDRRFILTGTPMTQGPLDLYSQMKFLHEKAPGCRTWTAFKNKYAIQEQQYAGMRSFTAIVGYRNLDQLTETLKPFTLRLTKRDCLDLPNKMWQTIHIEMTADQKKIYKELRDHALSELSFGGTVSSTLPLTTIIKLQQICSGFVVDDNGKEHELPCNKIHALLQIARSSKPLVVFCSFRRNVKQVSKALSEVYGDDKVVEYIGGMDQQARTDARNKFQKGEADFIVCTSAGAKGITLTRASTMVYYSNTYQLETRLQSQDRIHRIGQTENCHYIDLVSPGTIDEVVLEALNNKEDLSKMVLTKLVALIRQS